MLSAVGVVVPAHDEQDLLPACLAALRVAAEQPVLLPVDVLVVADACSDRTAAVARATGARVLEVEVRNAGAARAAGIEELLRGRSERWWLATTDADSRVPANWLTGQLRHHAEGYDAVVGTVEVDDWSGHHAATASRFAQLYGKHRDGHQHVHGANLGLSGAAYARVGGFPTLALAEDHALVDALVAHGLRVARVGDLPVLTSGRRDARARGGFGDLLARLSRPSHLVKSV